MIIPFFLSFICISLFSIYCFLIFYIAGTFVWNKRSTACGNKVAEIIYRNEIVSQSESYELINNKKMKDMRSKIRKSVPEEHFDGVLFRLPSRLTFNCVVVFDWKRKATHFHVSKVNIAKFIQTPLYFVARNLKTPLSLKSI